MLRVQKKFLGIILFSVTACNCFSQTFQYNLASPKQRYAVSRLKEALQQDRSGAAYTIKLVTDSIAYGNEDFSIKKNGKKIMIAGGSDRALIYGCLAIAEDIGNGIALKDVKEKNEKAFLPFRAIKFDLPWDTYRHSYALSLHDETCRDTSYWKSFLDMMADNRFNAAYVMESSSLYLFNTTQQIFRKRVRGPMWK